MIVQTFQPDARAVVHAARHDVAGFMAEELDRRRALAYPPFCHLVRIVVSGPDPADAMRALEELKFGLSGEELLGPAPLLRLRNRHRAQLVGKTDGPRRSRRGRRGCSRPPLRRCAAPASPPSSTSIRSRSERLAHPATRWKSTWSRHSPAMSR